jgi:hypothetical protein
MMKALKEMAIPLQEYEKLPPEEKQGKISRGIFLDKEAPEFVEEYEKLMARFRAEGGDDGAV